jgi:hypothetical protein
MEGSSDRIEASTGIETTTVQTSSASIAVGPPLPTEAQKREVAEYNQQGLAASNAKK